ncbi:unnamed protein product [Dimorphilus gyrociliatus]|nr:unnamed protein product [Dimorphilus gyrociliatus]
MRRPTRAQMEDRRRKSKPSQQTVSSNNNGDFKRFSEKKVQTIIEDVMTDLISNNDYQADKAASLATEISLSIKSKVKDIVSERYKLIVHTTIGEKRNQGQMASRCLWGPSNDSYVSHKYENKTIVAVSIVFACYYD